MTVTVTGTGTRGKPPVIVSLTTIPARNGTLGPTITSLLSQLLAPDEIRVYAPPDCERPAALGGIAWIGGIADLGPLTKLSAVRDLALPDDAIVVTCDDDQIYDPRWLETLVSASRAYPNCAVGLAGWNARGFLLGERGRDHYEWVRPPSTCDVLEGYAGVAYRRSFFDDAIWDPPTGCRMVDDVWISGYLHRLGIVRRVTDHKLCRPAPSDRAGLHTRGDFVALNRAAARMMFGVIPATAPALSIVIPSLASRRQLLERLLACLGRQGHRDEIEILVEVDDGRATTGTKRNRLVAKARGAYICHIDDDDLVAPDYLETILDAIYEHGGVARPGSAEPRSATKGQREVGARLGSAEPRSAAEGQREVGVDVLWIRGQRRIVDGEEAGVLTFDYGCGPHVNGRIVDDALWRQVGHLCPIRAAIAKATPFPELTVGEDLRWANAVAPKIVTSARAGRPGQVLYYYEFSPHKKKPAMIDSSRRPSAALRGPAKLDLAIDSSRRPSAALRGPAKLDLAIDRPVPPAPPASPTPTPTSTPTPPRRDPARAARRAARAQALTPTTPPAGSHAEIFAPQYTSSSGPGSALSVTVPYRDFLARFIREHDVRSIVDLGCGDLEIMSHVDLGDASYLGIDVIAERIERNRKKLGDRLFAPPFGGTARSSEAGPWLPVKQEATGDAAALWKFIVGAEEGNLLLLSDCVSKFQVSKTAAETTLCAALVAGLVEPVFTLKDSDRVIEQVEWSTDLQSFRRTFQTEDGSEIDGADPARIAVGFRRVHDAGVPFFAPPFGGTARSSEAGPCDRPRFSFSVGDARTLPMSSIAGFDLLIIKDVLQHWTNAEVTAWLARWHFAVQRPRYALVTNCNYGPTVNRDVAAGGWRALDLTRTPFGVGKVVLRWALPRGPHVDYKDVVLLERA